MESKLPETVGNILKHGFSVKDTQSVARITNSHAQENKKNQKTQQTNAHVQKIGKTAHADRFGMQIIVK